MKNRMRWKVKEMRRTRKNIIKSTIDQQTSPTKYRSIRNRPITTILNIGEEADRKVPKIKRLL